jgi:hypothetical protein
MRRVVSNRDIQLFSAVSGDVNPAHVDALCARSSDFQGITAQGHAGCPADLDRGWLAPPSARAPSSLFSACTFSNRRNEGPDCTRPHRIFELAKKMTSVLVVADLALWRQDSKTTSNPRQLSQ